MSTGTHSTPTDRGPSASACFRSPSSHLPIRSQRASPQRAGAGYSRRYSKRSLPLGKQFSKKRRRNAPSTATPETIEFHGANLKPHPTPPPTNPLPPPHAT